MGARIVIDLSKNLSLTRDIIPFKSVIGSTSSGNGLWFSDYSSIATKHTDNKYAINSGILGQMKANNEMFPMLSANVVEVTYDISTQGFSDNETVNFNTEFYVGYVDYNLPYTRVYKNYTFTGNEKNVHIRLLCRISNNTINSFGLEVKKVNENGKIILKNLDVHILGSKINAYTKSLGTRTPFEIDFTDTATLMSVNPIPTTVGVWSSGINEPLECTFVFGRLENSLGVGLEVIAESVTVEWYKDETKIFEKTKGSSGKFEYIFFSHLADFDTIKVKLNHTKTYARIIKVIFGEEVEISGDELQNCKIFEEEDTTALTMPSNYCDFTIVSPLFNIWNNTNEMKVLSKNTKIKVFYDYSNGESEYFGLFHARDIESRDDGSCHVKAYDWIYLLGDTNDLEGFAYGNSVKLNPFGEEYANNKKMLGIISIDDNIFKYTGDSQEEYTTSAYFSGGSSRDAYAYIFANTNRKNPNTNTDLGEHLYCTTSRSDTIDIRDSSYLGKSKVYTEDDYFENPKISIDKKPTSIVVKYKKYALGNVNEYETIFEGDADAGTIVSTDFSNKIIAREKNGDRGADNWGVFAIEIPRDLNNPIIVKANKEKSVDAQIIWNNTEKLPYNKQLTIETNCTDENVAKNISQRLGAERNKEFIVEFETEFDNSLCGDTVEISYNDNSFKGTLLSQEIDITGGLLMKKKIRGNRVPSTKNSLSLYKWKELENISWASVTSKVWG